MYIYIYIKDRLTCIVEHMATNLMRNLVATLIFMLRLLPFRKAT